MTIVFNAGAAYKRKKIKDKEYLVVPMVMLVEGVHKAQTAVRTDAGAEGKAQDGGVLYTANELERSANVWNHKPVVVYHPKKKDANGVPLSATDPDNLTETAVGIVLNTRFDKSAKKLRAEAWLDEKELADIAPDVLKNIKAGKPTELSTGLSMDMEEKDGEFGGAKYSVVAYNYRPDHLAIIPKGVGACSVRKGAGLCVANFGGTTELEEAPAAIQESMAKAVEDAVAKVGGVVVENAMSFSQVSCALAEALGSKYGEKGKSWYGYLVEIFPDYCVFRTSYDSPGRGSKYLAQKYTTSDAGVELVGSAVEVTPASQYVTKDGTAFVANEGVPDPVTEVSMNREKMVAYLVNNCGYTADELKDVKDDDLFGLKPKARTAEVQNTGKAETPPPALTWADIERLADPKTKQTLKSARSAHDKEVAALVDVIVQNEGNPFEKSYLTGLGDTDIDLLRGIALPYQKLAAAEAEPARIDPRFRTDGPFGGASGGIVHNKGKKDDDFLDEDEKEPLTDGWARRNATVLNGAAKKKGKKAQDDDSDE